ncbi:MAG TPA: SRPBCC family protein [Thermoanaerobaculia bacterium]|nr:SRPBCC family protein [Thermoanaerobaculia bacterium]
MFDAPRTMVFEAWTDARHLAQWWGPYHFTNPICEVDARPGGAIRIGMQAPDGTVYPNRGEFREVVPPERLVFTLAALDDDGKTLIDALITATFEAHGEQTKLSVTARVISFAPEAAAFLAGMEEGWSQQLERLETFLDSPSTFVFSRTFDAPRALVYRVWTEREHLLQWWGPKGFTVASCSNDLRPGGVMHYQLRGPGHMELWARWVYRELAPPERIVFVTSFSDEQGNITRAPFDEQWPLEMLNALTFDEKDGRTTVTLRSRAIRATDEERAVFHRGHASMTNGWGGTFDVLGAYVAKVRR